MSSSRALVDSRRVYDGRVVSLRVDRIRLSGGAVYEREVVEHPGAVAVLPLLDDGRLLLIKQYRHPVGEMLLEIPAGTLHDGETPEECARRELVEETGYEPQAVQELFSCYMAPGYSSEKIHIFLASKLKNVGGRPEVDEQIELEPITLEEAEAMLKKGEMKDSKTIAGISYLLITRDQIG